ncbi:MAG: 4-phosphoerythronate dehydrogenase [Lentisphaerae bacterium]|nr:4-phosphoerythronate dehydrogenase [Lentisphaerota bacterium]
MKIVCAVSVLQGRDAFSSLGQVVLRPNRDISRADLADARALIVRSKTIVNRRLLEGTPVEFVATATAGSDHLDTAWLDSAGIAWTASPGCNANAVAEYVLTAIALLAQRHGAPPRGKTLGIIGVGQVGSRVAAKAPLLGIRPLLNDPPLTDAAPSANYLPLTDLLPRSDIISLHPTLTDTPPHPSRHLANAAFFELARPGAWFLNTSRGAITDSDALRHALDTRRLSACVLDVWEREPELSPHLAQAADYLTPHIAGYSLEGLLNGTLQCHQQLARHLNREPTWTPDPRQLPPLPVLHVNAANRSDHDTLAEVLAAACPIPTDDHAWRHIMQTTSTSSLRTAFDQFRKNYTNRREFSACRLHLANASPSLRDTLAALGFQLQNATP